MNTAWAEVISVESPRHGCIRLTCRMPDGGTAPALAYPALGARVRAGDRVLLNTTAMELGLGTGGLHFVIAGEEWGSHPDHVPGHIIKLRYTPLQTQVLAVEEADSPWHDALEVADSLDGLPVIACELASQVPAVLAGCRFGDPAPRVTLVHTDEAALPLAFSDLFAQLRSDGMIHSIITTGQSFGGDFEAVNVYSGLLAARIACDADIAIVSPGPGTVGTSTRFGFGGVAQGEALNAIHALGGRAVAALRISVGDIRARHQGISHHSLTILNRIALGNFSVAWPDGASKTLGDQWKLLQGAAGARMTAVEMAGAGAALDAAQAGLPPWNSMGRSRDDDPLFFEAAAAAGLLARRFWRRDV